MKLKCSDGKVRHFLVCRNETIETFYGPVMMSRLLEAECAECGEKFGCHDTHILKPKFLAHVCAVEHSVQSDDATTERHGQTSTDDRIYSTQATGATPHRR